MLLQVKVKGTLAFGYVALDAVVQRALQLVNSGLTPATYRVDVEGLPLQFSPTDGKLSAAGSSGSDCTIKAELTAEIAGPLSGKILLCSKISQLPRLCALISSLKHL